MGHRILRVLPHVEDEPVAAVVTVDPLLGGNGARGVEHGGEVAGVVLVQRAGVVDVPAGNHEDVHGRLGRDVSEGDRALGRVHDVGWDVPGDDRAKEAAGRAQDSRPSIERRGGKR